MGLIEGPASGTEPPARPIDDFGTGDWLWLQPLLWKPGILAIDAPTVTTPTMVIEASAENVQVKAQRAADAGGSKIWSVVQWLQPLAQPFELMSRKIWSSTAVLLP